MTISTTKRRKKQPTTQPQQERRRERNKPRQQAKKRKKTWTNSWWWPSPLRNNTTKKLPRPLRENIKNNIPTEFFKQVSTSFLVKRKRAPSPSGVFTRRNLLFFLSPLAFPPPSGSKLVSMISINPQHATHKKGVMFEVRREGKRKKGLMYRYKAFFFLAPAVRPKGGNFILAAKFSGPPRKESEGQSPWQSLFGIVLSFTVFFCRDCFTLVWVGYLRNKECELNVVGDWSLGGRKSCIFQFPLWSSLHLTQCRSVVAIKSFQRSVRRFYGRRGFFLFTLDHPFGWLCIVSHSPFPRSTSRPFLFLYMGSSSCSNNKHNSQRTSMWHPSRNYHDWGGGRGILLAAPSRLEHFSCPECAVSSISRCLRLDFCHLRETLLLSPPLGSYLFVAIRSLFLPHPFWLCSSVSSWCVSFQEYRRCQKEALLFHARGY